MLELPNKASITDPQVERAGALTKFTAAQVKENYPKQLRDLGEQAAAHLSEACTHKEKYEQHLEDAKQILDQVRDLCDDSGFAAFYDLFHETFCPNVGRSRTYELLAITTGKKTIENTRADTRERVRRHRAKQKESVTVTDSFNKLIALLLQKIKKQQPKHFINTPHTADEFKQLATFFTNLAKLKQQSLDLKDAA